tara:strand:+ start:7724 stop:8083 length:360 start_codon:yes stop_codon:yes gene_type:complete
MVQQYHQRVQEAGTDAAAIERARFGLAEFCRQGVQELMEKGHKGLLILGKPSMEGRFKWFAGPLNYHHMDDGNLYAGFPIPTYLPKGWARKEAQLHDIPFETYKADDLIRIATEIEKAK